MKQFRSLADIRSAIPGDDGGGDEKAIGEHGGFFGIPIPIRVLEDNNFVVGRLAGKNLRSRNFINKPTVVCRPTCVSQ